jgi:hypothetical protein
VVGSSHSQTKLLEKQGLEAKRTTISTTGMTRFSTVVGVVAAVMVWLVSSNGCIAALVQARSDTTAAMTEERRSLYVALDSITQADEAGHKNLRLAAVLNPGKKDQDGMEGRDTNETENHVQGQRKLARQSNKALQTSASSSSSVQSFLDAMLHKSSPVSFSSRSASSTIRNISPSHQRDLLRKMNESEINDSCSDSNPTLVASGGAMVTGSLKGAQSSIAESCTWSDAGNVGLWCKYTVFAVSLLCCHFEPRVTRF